MSTFTLLSEDELVAYLKRTSLPTLMVEGSGDAQIYRYLESRLEYNASILIAGGRPTLLKVFSRRNEFEYAKVVFLADRDMWLFTSVPEEYSKDIIYTNGYSIENDLYAQNLFEALLNDDERNQFQVLIGELCRWFGFEVERFIDVGFTECDIHINRICEEYLRKIAFIEPNSKLLQRIKSNYVSNLRGKNLLQALIRFLSAPKRQSKYSLHNLLEMGAKLENRAMDNLCANLNALFYLKENSEWVSQID